MAGYKYYKSFFTMNFSNNNIIPNIPAPIVGEIEVLAFRQDNNPVDAVKALLKGEYVLVEDVYSTGLAILAKLKLTYG